MKKYVAVEVTKEMLAGEHMQLVPKDEYDELVKKANQPPPDDRAERLRIAVEMFLKWFDGDATLPKGDTVESYAKKGVDWAFMCADLIIAKSKSIDEEGK